MGGLSPIFGHYGRKIGDINPIFGRYGEVPSIQLASPDSVDRIVSSFMISGGKSFAITAQTIS